MYIPNGWAVSTEDLVTNIAWWHTVAAEADITKPALTGW